MGLHASYRKTRDGRVAWHPRGPARHGWLISDAAYRWTIRLVWAARIIAVLFATICGILGFYRFQVLDHDAPFLTVALAGLSVGLALAVFWNLSRWMINLLIHAVHAGSDGHVGAVEPRAGVWRKTLDGLRPIMLGLLAVFFGYLGWQAAVQAAPGFAVFLALFAVVFAAAAIFSGRRLGQPSF